MITWMNIGMFVMCVEHHGAEVVTLLLSQAFLSQANIVQSVERGASEV